MRLTQLRSFHAVARAGGFTGGARLLHISQPTVTTQVRFLEDACGIELFYRRGHSVSLTPMGEQLFEMAQKIFALETETIHMLKDSGELKSGHLRVGAVGPFHVTEMLARFNRRFPGVQMSVRMGNSEAVLSALLEYRTDIGQIAARDDGFGSHVEDLSFIEWRKRRPRQCRRGRGKRRTARGRSREPSGSVATARARAKFRAARAPRESWPRHRGG